MIPCFTPFVKHYFQKFLVFLSYKVPLPKGGAAIGGGRIPPARTQKNSRQNLSFFSGAGNRTRFAFPFAGERKLRFASVEPSAATLIRVAFKWVRIRSLNYQKKRGRSLSFLLVPVTGLEPVRFLRRGILSPLCLPIPPYRRGIYSNTFFPHRQVENRTLFRNIFQKPRKILYCKTRPGVIALYYNN